jgi:hypothetical protein
MDFVTYDKKLAGPFVGQVMPAPEKSYSFGEIAAAAFRQDNEIVNGMMALTRPAFPASPQFDILAAIKLVIKIKTDTSNGSCCIRYNGYS